MNELRIIDDEESRLLHESSFHTPLLHANAEQHLDLIERVALVSLHISMWNI